VREIERDLQGKAPAVPHTPRSVVQKESEETGSLAPWTLELYAAIVRLPLEKR
jgi:hypothetical protein